MCQKVLAKFPCLTIYIPFSLHRSQRTPYSHRLKYTHQATFLKKKIKNHFLSHTEGLTALQNASKDLYEPCHIAAHRQLQDRSQAQQPMRNSQERGFISALRFASLPYQGEHFRAQMTLQIELHPLRSTDAGFTLTALQLPPRGPNNPHSCTSQSLLGQRALRRAHRYAQVWKSTWSNAAPCEGLPWAPCLGTSKPPPHATSQQPCLL